MLDYHGNHGSSSRLVSRWVTIGVCHNGAGVPLRFFHSLVSIYCSLYKCHDSRPKYMTTNNGQPDCLFVGAALALFNDCTSATFLLVFWYDCSVGFMFLSVKRVSGRSIPQKSLQYAWYYYCTGFYACGQRDWPIWWCVPTFFVASHTLDDLGTLETFLHQRINDPCHKLKNQHTNAPP